MHPGFDGLFGTDDDVFGSGGVRSADSAGNYEPSALFGFETQVTGRTAQTTFMAAYFDELFWDGRAGSAFVDPETGEVVIAAGGGLESQAVEPLLSPVEMSNEGRTWAEITGKLAAVQPMKLAGNLTPDIQAALDDPTTDSYPELFAAAFPADPAISARNIGFALASYQRTLIPDDTPYDRFLDGDLDALTPAQQNGLAVFNETDPGGGRCVLCHTDPLFSDDLFHNVGRAPSLWDLGRAPISMDPADRGKFKTPSLRNAGRRNRFFHDGVLTGFGQVTAFYIQGGDFDDNLDPLMMELTLAGQDRQDLADFIENGLTDARAVNGEAPFDRPSLFREWFPDNPTFIGEGVAGTGGFVPRMIADAPPSLGTPGFKVGVSDALGGALAFVRVGTVGVGATLEGPITLGGEPGEAGAGHGTFFYELPDDPGMIGQVMRFEWIIPDAGSPAPDGRARSPVAQFELF